MDDYTTLLWTPLCEEVGKLRVTLRHTPVPTAAAAAIGGGAREPEAIYGLADGDTDRLVTGLVTSPGASIGNASGSGFFGPTFLEREKGLEPSTSTLARWHSPHVISLT